MSHVNFADFLKLRPDSGPKVLCIDIETFPIIGYVWALFKQNIGLKQIARDWSIMSFSCEWLDNDANFYADNRYEDDVRDDTRLAALLHTLLNSADVVLARNGKKFDLPKIKARLAILGFTPIKPLKVIDPMLLNRDEFGFTSHKLEYTTGVLVPELRKSTHSAYPGFELWYACMMNDPLAWVECESYNRTDVVSMKAEYMKLRGWYRKHPNMAIYVNAEQGQHTCGTCGSGNVTLLSDPAFTEVGIYNMYHCGDCGKYQRGRALIADKHERAHVLVNN